MTGLGVFQETSTWGLRSGPLLIMGDSLGYMIPVDPIYWGWSYSLMGIPRKSYKSSSRINGVTDDFEHRSVVNSWGWSNNNRWYDWWIRLVDGSGIFHWMIMRDNWDNSMDFLHQLLGFFAGFPAHGFTTRNAGSCLMAARWNLQILC